MIRGTKVFIAVAAVSLIVASLIHLGLLIEGYRHQQAGVAEMVIAAVMVLGLAFTWRSGRRGMLAGVVSLALGLLGALVGLFTIVIGVGPRTLPDVAYHLGLIVVLSVGLVTGWRGLSAQRRLERDPSAAEPES